MKGGSRIISKQETGKWEDNYQRGRSNKYPFDMIVSFVLRYYKKPCEYKMLDLGCGGGNHTVFLAENGFNTYAVDGSSTAVDITCDRLKDKHLNAIVKTASFLKLPFKDRFFDCVIDRGSIICNRWKDIVCIYDEVFRVLKIGGRYIGTVVNTDHPQKTCGILFEKNTFNDFKDSPSFNNSDIIHFFSIVEIKQLMKKYVIELVLRYDTTSIINSTKYLYDASRYFMVVRK